MTTEVEAAGKIINDLRARNRRPGFLDTIGSLFLQPSRRRSARSQTFGRTRTNGSARVASLLHGTDGTLRNPS
jgi:hypothetical protein